jgi:hypothetical protein
MREGGTMKAPRLTPAEVRQRVIVLPEAEPPKKRRWLRIGGIVALAVWTAAVSGIGVYLWQRGEIQSRDRAIASSRRATAIASAGLAQANGRLSDLQAELATSKGDLAAAQTGLTLAQIAANKERQHAANLQQKLASRDASLQTALGPRLTNGDHLAFVVGIDVTGSRVLIDTGQWFTGAAARRAAQQDGVTTRLTHGRYVRNPDHLPRFMHVSFSTIVTLRNYPGATGAFHTTLPGLGSIFGQTRKASDTIRLDPFWVHVQHGEIDGMTQQQYQPPS